MKTRRDFLKQAAMISACVGAVRVWPNPVFAAVEPPKMKLGLVTYQWGMDWDVPTLISNCEKAGLSGIELRVDHAHNVTPKLSADERKTVAKRFADSSISLVGFGTTFEFHSPDPASLRKHIEGSKEYVLLAKDCGATGIKVRPNALPSEVEKEKTIAQIARSLSEVGRFAAEHGQEIRLEIHGGCAPIPIIKSIIDQVPEKNVGLCWNCNQPDLADPGLKANFASVKNRLSGIIHIRDLASESYPTRELFDLLRAENYGGFLLIEEGDGKLSSEERMKRLGQSANTFAEWWKG
jgi:sugar phosphate isomerase/epimerase